MLETGKILPLPAPPSDGDIGPLPPAQVAETTEDNNQDRAEPASAPVATHTRAIGIIHPPPDIRSIVDKTSQFVARNGADFEKRIIGNNAGNAKFNFLNPSDPYHAYYQHRLAEFRAQTDPSPQPQKAQSQDSDPAPSSDPPAAIRPDPAAKFRPTKEVALEPPEAEKYTVRLPEGITGEELEIIKLTAQFAAVNKKSNFAVGLANREMNNPQFHFLKPTHSMYSFFYALANAYSLVYEPPEGIRDELREKNLDTTTVLERCVRRLEWERSQEQARQQAEDEIEQERIQMAMIDWHDFVVVETIDFADDEDEDLPPPMSLEEVIRRSKISSLAAGEENGEEANAVEPNKEVEMEMDEEEAQLLEEGMRAAKLEESNEMEMVVVTSHEPDDEDIPRRIVKNWKRPEERIPAERDPTKYAISPMSGELIPISHMSEHVRVSLIDPKFREQKERMFAKIRDTTLASDDEISRNIIGLARTRPDIFGTTEEEVSNAVKAEIEKEQPKQVIWDGHTGSIGRTANQAMSQNSLLVSTADDISAATGPPPRPAIMPVRPLPPPPGLALNLPRVPVSNVVQYPPPPIRPPVPVPMPMHMMPMVPGQQQPVFLPNRPVSAPPGSQFPHFPAPPRPFVPLPGSTIMPPPPPMPLPLGMPPPPPEEAPPPLPEEPEPKRQKHDESLLVPEDQFLAQHPGPVRVTVSVPNVDEGNLKGQFIEIMVQSLSETVGSLKEKIAGEIQLPANKQKLSGKAGFLKDNMTLAYYNIGAGEALALSLRERGGRKR